MSSRFLGEISFKKLLGVCLLIVCSSKILLGQNQELDSLLTTLKNRETLQDSTTADLLNAIGYKYLTESLDLDTVILYLDKALDLSSSIDYPRGEARANHIKGIVHYYNGDYEEGLVVLFKSLTIYQKMDDVTGIFKNLKNISALYQKSGDLSKAIFYGKEALTLSEKIGSRLFSARIMNNLGNVYLDFRDSASVDTGKVMYSKALLIYKEFQDDLGISRALNNLGSLYDQVDQPDSAIWYLEQSLAIDRKINTDPYGLCNTLNSIADHYINIGDYPQATAHLDESILIANKNAFKQQLSIAYSSYESLYRKQGNFQKAYETLRDKEEIDRQLVHLKQNEIVEDLNAKYESEKKEQAIQSLENKAAIQALEISRKNQNLIIFSILTLFLILALVLIYVIYRQKRINLVRKADEIEQRLLRLQMNPHFIFNALSSIQEFVASGDESSASRYLTKFSRLIRTVLEDSRNDYIPLAQEIKLLDSYISLQNLRRKVPFNYSINVDPKINAEELAIPPMFAQPFIENAIEHGISDVNGDALIEIDFALKGDQVSLKIADNGVGIEATTTTKKNGHQSLATQITRERIELLKKNMKKEISFKIISSKGQGTSVLFLLPLKYT